LFHEVFSAVCRWLQQIALIFFVEREHFL